MHIGIIGLGLIGGSIAKTLKKVHSQNSYIIGYDANPLFLDSALESGTLDKAATEIGADFAKCNVIFICTPISYTTEIVRKVVPHVSGDCIITDICSTKYNLIKEIEGIAEISNKNLYFVGGHPMCGSEKSGYFASTDYLFENAYYMLTPMADTPNFIVFILQKLIERLGAIPLIITPSYHDFATATVSHLPHIIASGLVHLVKNNDGNNHYLHTLAAGGFKDITRIASSNPTIWHDICVSNKDEIQKIFKRYIDILNDFSIYLESNDDEAIYNYFDSARSYRDTFNEGINSELVKNYTIFVDAKDEPGIIASIATLLSSHGINIKDIGIMNHREFACGVLRIALASKSCMIDAHQILSKHNYTIYY